MAKLNLIDRAIGYVAPGVAARRVRNRLTLDFLQRGYDGASRGRKNNSWGTPNSSADAEIAAAGPLLRDRMRDLVRNNPHAANAVAQLVAHIVGDGIVPRAKTGNARRDKKINKLFERFSKQCDRVGKLDFYGIQALAVREMIESGDGIVRRYAVSSREKRAVPLELRVVETDLIDGTRMWPMRDGSYAVNGVQLDADGKPTAYWMYETHPGNGWVDPRGSVTSRPIPAKDVAHAYEVQRTQVRGVPWGAPVISSLHHLGTYEEAEIVRKKIESCVVGVLVGADDDDGIGVPLADGERRPAGIYDADGYVVERFEPGMFAVAKGGKDIKFNSPSATGSYEAYKNSQLHTIAAGFRLPYALLSGDLRQVNYSSSKIGMEAFKRLVSATQWQVVIPMICQPIWEWFCEAAYAADLIDTRVVDVEWTPPRFMSADPKKDAEGTVAEVRAGLKSPQRAIAETGYDPDEVLAEFAEWNAKLDAAGIILDSDPRRVTQQGQTHPPDPSSTEREEGEPADV